MITDNTLLVAARASSAAAYCVARRCCLPDWQLVNPGESPLAVAEGSTGEVAAPKRCGFTKQELLSILKEAEYNASSLAYSAPSVAASSPPSKPCGFTQEKLMGLMEKVD